MRAINQTIRPYKALELHPNITKIVSLAHTKEGLTLVTGITGSGKSSTLDAMIDLNNHTVDGHIVIIASPIEFVHKSDRCIVRHREVGRDVLSFKDGAIQALRQDPDIIVIGEMRDPETIMVSLEITDSGHKVFSTLHTASAVESIDRIIGEVPPVEQERVQEQDGRRAAVRDVAEADTEPRRQTCSCPGGSGDDSVGPFGDKEQQHGRNLPDDPGIGRSGNDDDGAGLETVVRPKEDLTGVCDQLLEQQEADAAVAWGGRRRNRRRLRSGCSRKPTQRPARWQSYLTIPYITTPTAISTCPIRKEKEKLPWRFSSTGWT